MKYLLKISLLFSCIPLMVACDKKYSHPNIVRSNNSQVKQRTTKSEIIGENPTTTQVSSSIKGSAIVIVDVLNIRDAASKNGSIIGTLNKGDKISYDRKESRDGYIWVSYKEAGNRHYVAIGMESGDVYAQENEEVSFTKAPRSSGSFMKFDEMRQGDFSSLQGTWQNRQGNKLVFTDSTHLVGIYKDGESSGTIRYIGEKDGLLTWTIAEIQASPPVFIAIPAGSKLTRTLKQSVNDTSDISQDRIFTLPQGTFSQSEFENLIFYKVE